MTRIAGLSPEVARELLAFYRQAKATGLFGIPVDRSPQFVQPVPTYVTNTSGEAIPPYGCMQAVGMQKIGSRNYVQVDKPADATGEAGGFLFNGPREIAIDGLGVGRDGRIAKALGDGSTATAGERWSPAASSWTIEPGGSLFTMIGADEVATDVVRVFVESGGDTRYRFTLTSAMTTGTGTADIYEMDGTTAVESGATISVGMNALKELVSGDRGWCWRQDGVYYIGNAGCPGSGV